MDRKKLDLKGFTLVELVVVIAVIAILIGILAPAYTKYVERSRESTDLANARSAYSEIMMRLAEKDEIPDPITIPLKQKMSDWQTPLPISIGGVTFDGEDTDNWVGTPVSNGTCVVSYNKDKGTVFTWSGGSGTQRPIYTGDLKETEKTLKDAYKLLNNSNMQDGRAFFSGQKFKIKGTYFTTRVYYADSEKFKEALVSYILKPTSYENSPFYRLEDGHEQDKDKRQGFAYYTYGDGNSIKEFTYVNEKNVYRTTDGGKTWYDITPY
ncbi:type II secretion system protein [Blautia sp.]